MYRVWGEWGLGRDSSLGELRLDWEFVPLSLPEAPAAHDLSLDDVSALTKLNIKHTQTKTTTTKKKKQR